jgi:hypothetical protein
MSNRIDLLPDQKFKLHGKIYIAVPAKNSCYGCAFRELPEDCFKTPPCAERKRLDRTSVIYIRETN